MAIGHWQYSTGMNGQNLAKLLFGLASTLSNG